MLAVSLKPSDTLFEEHVLWQALNYFTHETLSLSLSIALYLSDRLSLSLALSGCCVRW